MRYDFGYSENDEQITLLEFSLWKRILSFAAPYRFAIGMAIFLSISITGTSLAIPWLVRNAVDSFIINTTLDINQRFTGIGHLSFYIAALIIFEFIAGFAQVGLLEWTGQHIMHSMRMKLFAHLLSLDLQFFNSKPTGSLVTRVTNDIQNMHDMFTSVIVTVCNDLLRLAGIFILIFIMDYRLALVLTTIFPLLLGNTILFSRLARKVFRSIRLQLAAINSYFQETLSNITVVQLFNRQTLTAEKFSSLNKEFYQRSLRQIKIFAFFMPLVDLMATATLAAIIVIGGQGIIEGRITIGVLVAFLAYLRLFFQPLRELSQKYSIVQSAMASAERIFQLLDTPATIIDNQSSYEPTVINGHISFNKVVFGYNANEKILRSVSFDVYPGQTVAIVGATGAGKTTIINLLERFYEPQKGIITLDDTPLHEIKIHWLRKQIGLVMQDVFVIPTTLRANIELDHPLTEEHFEKILAASQLVHMTALLPNGDQTILGEGGFELSTGQKQLLAFARVLARDPKILVMDEATANIDSETEMFIEKAIAHTLAGRTNIVIAHRLSTIKRADHILVMDQGQIMQQGSHKQLMQQKGLYSYLQNLQVKGLEGDDPE